jgi:hypothetical protein
MSKKESYGLGLGLEVRVRIRISDRVRNMISVTVRVQHSV